MKNKKQKKLLKNLVEVFVKIYDLVKKYRRFFVISLIITGVIEAVQLGGTYIFKEIIDTIIVFDPAQIRFLIYLIVGSFFVYFVKSILEYFNDTLIVKVQIKISHYLSVIVYNKLLNLSLGYHERESTGAKLSKIDNGTGNVRQIIDRALWDFFPTIIRMILSFGFLLYINWIVALCYISIIPFFVWATLRMNYRVYPIQKNIRKGFERVYGKFGQAIYNVQTVQAYAQEEREKKRAKVGIWGIIRNQFNFSTILFRFNFLRFNLIGLGNVIVIIAGVWLVTLNRLTPGELVLFITVANSSYYALYGLSRIFDQIMEAKVGVERILKILGSQDEIKQDKEAKKLNVKGEIEFKDVNFTYGTGESNVLRGVSLKIKPGETVALVGPSGGGKTTIAKLIYRYFDVTAGSLCVDGVDIKDLDLKNYREQLGVVTQDIDIFNDSVAANISYGNAKASLQKIKEAAKIANADHFIEELKNKYKTIVGERGIKLSGGQKQRVGIARAILINPKILIFDEATSSLDAESEKMIQKAIKKVIQDRTTIIIAHRLSTIKNVDRIIVVDNGRIVEQGNHQELLAKKGKYAALIKAQIKGYLS